MLWDGAARRAGASRRAARRAGAHHPKCKGAIPEDHPLRAGCIIGGLIERNLVNQADLIVAVGLDAVELQPKPWPYTLPVLALSPTPSLDALVPADPEVVGDLKSLLAALAEWAPEGGDWGEAAAKTVPPAGARRARHAEHGPLAAARRWRSPAPCCRATPSPPATPGASRLLVVQKWEAYGPREFLTSNGLGSMGYAVPGAHGARGSPIPTGPSWRSPATAAS